MAWGRNQNQGRGGCLAWLALLLACVALVVAWAAYKRSGGEIGSVLKDAGLPSQGVDGDLAEWQEDLRQARDRLLGRRAEVAEDRNLEQVRKDVAQVRESLDHAYHKVAGPETKQQWTDVDRQLEQLEAELKQQNSKALASLDETLAKIRNASDGETGEKDGKDTKGKGDGRH
ncbi:MAG TPA: hypothetical protein VF173_37400 [Thermoanaerobaculia bacterium]|nr:hypothetical protein [Thermoanaerobaculia bacterium]